MYLYAMKSMAESMKGRDMNDYTKEDIFRIVEEEDVRSIRLQFTDMYGMPKNFNLPAGQLARALAGECVFDGSSIEGFIRRDEEDMFLRPDINTFAVFPLRGRDGATARMICDVYDARGQAFSGDPRHILKQAQEKAEALGYRFRISPELEFFLFHCDDEGRPTTENEESAGYFDMSPLDLGEGLRNEITELLEEVDCPVASSHHETSRGQHEIDFEGQDSLSCADTLATAKIMIKIIARRAGFHATFMPKPKEGVNGSGLHMPMALYDREDRNLFYDETDPHGLSETARRFMTGIIRHIGGMSLVLNPLVNSYKRIVPGYDAPVDISWTAGTNRGSLLRIPSRYGSDTKIELRSPDPACNPYLAFALVLSAGISGLGEKENLPGEGESLGSLPESFGEAIAAFREDPFIREVLGETFFKRYLEAKTREYESYKRQVSSWEVQEYLYKY